MSKDKRRKNQEGLWVPNEILNLFDIDNSCKLLLAHFYSFGEKGCYQSNKTLAQIFMTHSSTIKRRIVKLKKYLYIKNPKNYYRTVWVKFHPEVKSLAKPGSKMNHQQAQKCATNRVKSEPVSGSKPAFPPGQKCATTNTYTNTETNTETAADLPMPAGGQASRLLQERRAAAREKIEQFKKKFGSAPKSERMSPEEFEKRRQMILNQLKEE